VFVFVLCWFIWRKLQKSKNQKSRAPKLVSKKERQTMEAVTNVKISSILANDLINRKKSVASKFCDELRLKGYACLKVDPATVQISENMTKAALEYLNQSIEVKNNNLEQDRNNIGFVQIPKVREYIKLRPQDSPELWPQHPPNFGEVYSKFFEWYSSLAIACFEQLAQWVDEKEKFPRPLIREDDREAIREFLNEKSSISMIKYYPLDEPKEVCDEHTDTGILTFITRTHRPGLEMWDKSIQKFIKIEELTKVGDIIVFVGEKVPLFSRSLKFCATPHRVRLPPGPERLSIAFLLDVAK